MMNGKAKKAALFGLMVALAFTLSFLESLLPLQTGIPGVKLGLANLVVVTALYTMKPYEAFAVALIRIVLAGLTFGNTYSLIYSLCGGLLSFAVMLVMKRFRFSVAGISTLGGITHNIGQIIAAAFLMRTDKIIYYLPVLLLSGTVTGLLLGLTAKPLIERTNQVMKNGEQ